MGDNIKEVVQILVEIEKVTRKQNPETNAGKTYDPLFNGDVMSSGMINGKVMRQSPIKYNGRLRVSKKEARDIPKRELCLGIALSILSIMGYYILVLGRISLSHGKDYMILNGLMIAMFVSGSLLILYWGKKYNWMYEEDTPIVRTP